IGIDVTVAYNPEIVAIEEINAGEFLGANARVIVSDVETEGTLRFSALSSGGARLSEGVIFSLEVTGLTLGESELTVTSMSIFRRGGTIQAVSEAGLITVVVDSGEVTGELPTIQLPRRLTVGSGAGPNFDPVGTAEPNIELQVLGVSEDGAWYLIVLPDGVQGWIASSRFITFDGDINLLPIISETIEPPEETETQEPPTLVPTITPSPEPTVEETEAPVETEEAPEAPKPEMPPTAIPTNTPTFVPSNTSLPPTATLRGDSEAQIAPPASATPEATNTPTFVPTDTPSPTPTPTNTEP